MNTYCENIKEVEKTLTEIHSGVVVIFGAEKDFDYIKLQQVIRGHSVDIVGAKFPGIIHEGQLFYRGYVVLHFEQEYDLRFFTSTKTAFVIDEPIVKSGTGLIFVDGLAKGMQNILDELNFNIGADFTFAGSGAGSMTLKQSPCIFNKEGIYQNAGFVLLLKTNLSLGIGHGYKRLNGPIIATSVEGNVIKELNWDNPLKVYSQYVSEHCGQEINAKNFNEWCSKYPLGINRKGQEDIVRDPISCTNEGHIICIDEVPTNAALYLLYGESQSIIKAAQLASRTSMDSSRKHPNFILIIDCVTRVLYLEELFDKEMEVMSTEFNTLETKIPSSGLLSMGEISTYGDGKLELYNKTVLSAVINE